MKTLRHKLIIVTISILILSLILFMSNIINPYNSLIHSTIFLLSIVILYLLIIIVIVKNHKLKNIEKTLSCTLKINSAMLDISEVAITTEDVNDVLNFILEKAMDVIGNTSKGSIMKLRDDNYLEFIYTKGFNDYDLKDAKLYLDDSFLWVKSKGKIKNPKIIDIIDFYKDFDVSNLEHIFDLASVETIKSTITSPIFVNNKLYGMLNLDSEKSNAYTKEDIKIIEGFTNMVSIILKNHESLKKTIYQSKYDKLTNVYNRHSFEDILIDIMLKESGLKSKFSLVLIDIDNLKYINDIYGHLAGDELLQLFTTSIKKDIRYSDVFARYGGDEFIGLFFNISENDLVNKFERVKKYLSNNPLEYNDDKIICDFSYGIAYYPQDSSDYNELVEIADKRMYEYKEKNKKKSY